MVGVVLDSNTGTRRVCCDISSISVMHTGVVIFILCGYPYLLSI